MTEYPIVARDIGKRFGRHEVLRGVSLQVVAGSVAGLVGNNGSGKSVLLKCLCGLLVPDEGTVTINGRRMFKDIQCAPELGAVIEAPGFLPGRSGYRNLVSLWALNRRVPKDNIEKAIRQVGLDPMDRKGVGKYSMGMRQRLGLAQALMEDPTILILDEPLNGLDRAGVAEMYALLRALADGGRTMILASHNQADIDQLCASVYEIDAGRLTQVR